MIKPPGRKPVHPSGAGQKISVYLSPHHRRALDSLLTDERPTRSSVVAWLLDRLLQEES
jgi:hypothetical protein